MHKITGQYLKEATVFTWNEWQWMMLYIKDRRLPFEGSLDKAYQAYLQQKEFINEATTDRI